MLKIRDKSLGISVYVKELEIEFPAWIQVKISPTGSAKLGFFCNLNVFLAGWSFHHNYKRNILTEWCIFCFSYQLKSELYLELGRQC